MEWRRGGSTDRVWNHSGKVRCRLYDRGLVFKFSMSSAGGGMTDVELIVAPEEFDNLIETMCFETKNERHWRDLQTSTYENVKSYMELYDTAKERIGKLEQTVEQLRSENRDLKQRILNESVRPDRVAEFREKLLAAIIDVVNRT